MKVPKQTGAAGGDDLRDYWIMIRPWWKAIALTTFAGLVGMYFLMKYGMVHYYRATAILRPVSKSDQSGSLAGMLAQVAGTFSSFAGLSTDEEKDAQEYIAIFNSYAFTIEVIKRAHLAPQLIASSRGHRWFGWPVSEYRMYLKMTHLFDSDFSVKTTNLTISFLDPDRFRAQEVLGTYISLLREKLRRKEMVSASEAIKSLTKESADSSDVQLQGALYGVIASQLQRRAMAKVQSDFSFEVIEPPISPDMPAKPRADLDMGATMLLTPLIFSSILILKNKLSTVPIARPGLIDAKPLPLANLEDESVAFAPRAKSQG